MIAPSNAGLIHVSRVGENAFRRHASRGKEHRIRGREIIAFAVQNDELGERDQINDSDDAVTAALARSKQPE